MPAMLAANLAAAINADYRAGELGKSAEAGASFSFWRELFGKPPAGSAQEEMYETEVAQIVLSSTNPVLIRAAQAAAQG